VAVCLEHDRRWVKYLSKYGRQRSRSCCLDPTSSSGKFGWWPLSWSVNHGECEYFSEQRVVYCSGPEQGSGCRPYPFGVRTLQMKILKIFRYLSSFEECRSRSSLSVYCSRCGYCKSWLARRHQSRPPHKST
jgi:hypothetical protein